MGRESEGNILGELSMEGPSYEESLALVKMNTQRSQEDFKIKFLVTAGEFDRVLMGHPGVGLDVSYPLHISKDVLRWVRDQLRSLNGAAESESKPIFETLRRHLVDQVRNLEEKFIIRPWRGDLSRLIARELMARLVLYEGDFSDEQNKPQLSISIELIYGHFALRYIYDKRRHRQGH